MIKLKLLDVVRTKKGTIAVVAEITHGEAYLAFAKNRQNEKIAWYAPNELTVIGNVVDMVAKP